MTAFPFISIVCFVVITLAMADPGLCKHPESVSAKATPDKSQGSAKMPRGPVCNAMRRACNAVALRAGSIAGRLPRGASPNGISSLMPTASGVRVPFVANNGQLTDSGVLFYARTFGGTVFVHADGDIGYALSSTPSIPGDPSAALAPKTYVLRERFLDANPACPDGETRSPTRVSFFYGNDPSRWVQGQPSWETLGMGEIYDGIELRLRAYGNNVEKVFSVAPGADPDQISVTLLGADSLRIAHDGKLIAATCYGDVGFSAPVAWQEKDGKRMPVTVAYLVSRTAYGFELGPYDPALPVTLDPMLASTFLGGSGGDYARTLALDSAGNVYVAGRTASTNFPTTAGAYNTTNHPSANDYDIFVSKLDSSLSTLLASTYLGGGKDDEALAVALDLSGNVLLTGNTTSPNFPLTANAYGTNYLGAPNSQNGDDVFVSKLSADLSSLLASTYLAGYGWDDGHAVRADGAGNIYVIGNTDATNFPTTPGVFQPAIANPNVGNGGDVFVSKLNGNLTQLQASTYVGGRYLDEGMDGLLDSSGNIYVTGLTSSSNFPTTAGGYSNNYSGNLDGFVLIINNDLTALLASTYLGGNGEDYLYGLGRDADGNVYVAGYTESTDYPVTADAYQTSLSAYDDTIVSKFNSTLSTLWASTYLGAGGFDWALGVALDSSGNVYVAGTTDSAFFPTTSEEPNIRNTANFFVSKFDTDLTTLRASGRFGGGCDAVVVNATGTVYVAGSSNSTNFPVISGGYSTNLQGGYDAVITKLYMPDHVPAPIEYTPVVADFDGDGRADPVAVSNGFWHIWLSSQNYALFATSVGLPNDSQHLAADFDGDGKTDPAAALTTLWFVYPSTLNYEIHEYTYGAASGTAVAADFDGDGKADPTRVSNGKWYVYFSGSSAEYGPYELGYGDGTPLAADFDGDRKADPAVVLDGNWYVWLSTVEFSMAGPVPLGSLSGTPLAADFDGDRKADPAWFVSPDWYIWFSGSHYNLGGPYRFSIGSE